MITLLKKGVIIVDHEGGLGSCDRASWVKYEERKTNKMQQLDVYY